LLADPSILLSGSLDIDDILRSLTRLLVPRIADWCVTYVAEPDGSIRRLTVSHADPATAAALQQFLLTYPVGSQAAHPVEQALAAQTPTLYEVMGEQELRQFARDDRHLEILRRLGPRSLMVVPVAAGSRSVGVLLLAAKTPGWYRAADLGVVRELTHRAAVAIESARLYDAERRARAEAEAAQHRMGALTEMLDRALVEAELMNTIAAAAAGEHDLSRILAVTLDHLNRVVRFTGGSIALVEDDTLVIRAASGPFAERAIGQRMLRGPGRSWQVVELGKPFMSDDVTAEGLHPTTPLRSYLAVPLIWQDRAFGVMELDSTEPGAFGSGELRLLERVATILSGPIQLAQRYAAESRALAEAERARWRVSLLAEAGRVLTASLDYETTLANVAHLAVPALADWCIVDLQADDGALRQVAAAHARPDREPLIRELRRRYPPTGDHAIYRVMRTGRAELTSLITQHDLTARAVDDEHLRLLNAIGITSHMVVPLQARGRTLGVISFVAGTSGRRYDAADLILAEELARRAGGAIDNAYLYAAELAARTAAEQALQRVDAVNRLISIASSAADLGSVFDELGGILQTLVPFSRVAVSLYDPDTDSLAAPYFTGLPLHPPMRALEGPKSGTARGWVIDTGRPFIRDDTAVVQEYAEDEVLSASGLRSYMVVPMTVSSRVIGALHFSHSQSGFYTPEHAQLAQPVADHLALTISRYQLFEQVQRRAGELSETLQRALLPSGLPQPPFATLEALYLPADPDAGIGGDWYDALLLPDDSLLLSVGDVAGHGVPAAAVMGQVRHLVRAYGLEGRRPGEMLGAVNRFLSSLPEGQLLTLWIGVLDPLTGRLIYAGGGHPPFVLVRPDGQTQLVASAGLPVGFAEHTRYSDGEIVLPPGTRLIAYTDGLVEATRDIAAGEERLQRAALATRGLPAAAAVRGIAEQVLSGTRHEDDVALMVVDVATETAPLEFALPAVPNSLHRVRRAMRAYCMRLGLGIEHAEAVVIAVGEAALNTVEHAYRGTPDALVVRARPSGTSLIVEVIDRGQWRTAAQRGRGRGTRIMEGFAQAVRTNSGPTGTAVELTFQ
jgi:GAF domain-containing protein/anti-sigma regulatory factor (Ser/Thr protein kinase)